MNELLEGVNASMNKLLDGVNASMNKLLDGVNDSCSNSSLTHSNKRLQSQAQEMSRKYNFAVIKSSVKFSTT